MTFLDIQEKKSNPRETENTITVLVGPPGVGKDTWLKAQNFSGVVLSRDDILMEYVSDKNMTYSEAWKTLTDEDQQEIDRLLHLKYQNSIRERKDIVVNMTNMSKKSRKKWLNNVPSTYAKTIIVFMASLETIKERNKLRVGKIIPDFVIENMIKGFGIPTKDEAETIEFIFS